MSCDLAIDYCQFHQRELIAMIETEVSQALMKRPYCMSLAMVNSPDWNTPDPCIQCGIPVTAAHVEDIPEHLASALEIHECRDDGVLGTGAMYGALTYNAASFVFTLLPALCLNWKLQGSWKLRQFA